MEHWLPESTTEQPWTIVSLTSPPQKENERRQGFEQKKEDVKSKVRYEEVHCSLLDKAILIFSRSLDQMLQKWLLVKYFDRKCKRNKMAKLKTPLEHHVPELHSGIPQEVHNMVKFDLLVDELELCVIT